MMGKSEGNRKQKTVKGKRERSREMAEDNGETSEQDRETRNERLKKQREMEKATEGTIIKTG